MGYSKYREKKSRVNVVQTDFSLFDVKVWQDLGNSSNSNSRYYMFSLFLKDHDLIGMQQDKVLEMLGDADDSSPGDYVGNFRTIRYWLVKSAGSTLSAQIHFVNQTVDQWCFCRPNQQSDPVKTNVLITSDKGVWPETIPKAGGI